MDRDRSLSLPAMKHTDSIRSTRLNYIAAASLQSRLCCHSVSRLHLEVPSTEPEPERAQTSELLHSIPDQPRTLIR
ncbi:hypothetical protein EXN66_Car015007 [Channa argus]|uniref:Uncharacterized protein n=1 Tax=Channa argus TaxID=215402 RepID=A0A6G1Q9J4_CHAAH|nr:hypothetical protein EXN66_Car015007 [Channa argus]